MVPDPPEVLTYNAGWDTIKNESFLIEVIKEFHKHGIRTSIFIETDEKMSSYHVFLLRINNVNEAERDAIIQRIVEKGVSVNVHFIPLPMMTYYKGIGFNIDDFPVSYCNYKRVISLPVYYDLSDSMVDEVIGAVKEALTLRGFWTLVGFIWHATMTEFKILNIPE